MAGISGYGVSLAGATSLSTGVIEIAKIDLPELGVTDIDVSSMEADDNYEEFIAGMINPGVIDIEVNYDKTQDAAVLAAIAAANETWTITLPDGSTWETDGYINKHGAGAAGMNEKISRTLSIKCSGKPTFTPVV